MSTSSGAPLYTHPPQGAFSIAHLIIECTLPSDNTVIPLMKNLVIKKIVKWGDHVPDLYLDDQFGIRSDECDMPPEVPRDVMGDHRGPFKVASRSRGLRVCFSFNEVGCTILTCPLGWWGNVQRWLLGQ